MRLRRIWHDIFYALAPRPLVKLAMSCRDVAETIDLHREPQSRMGQFRLKLHLSLCQGCRNYRSWSLGLGRAVRSESMTPQTKLDLDLLRKYQRSPMKSDSHE